MNEKILIVIPCRIGSLRLSKKHLIELKNKKVMSEMVYGSCIKSNADKVLIATDSHEIYLRCKKFCDDVIITSSDHSCGTERVSEVSQKYHEYNIIINIQGDEVLIDVELINTLIAAMTVYSGDKSNTIFTAYSHFSSLSELNNINHVKLVVDADGNALYFSRGIIPYSLEPNISNYKKHIGVYGFYKKSLSNFLQLPVSLLEKIEYLEQLRALENGFSIKTIFSDRVYLGIDTLEDIDQINNII